MIAALIALFLKSAAVAGSALGLAHLLRRRTAAERATVLRAAVVVLIALPPAALYGPDLALRILEPAPVLQSLQPAVVAAPLPLPANDLSAEVTVPPLWTWLAGAWSLGALFILARFGLGLLTLARWSRRGRPVAQADWQACLHRLAPERRPNLRVSDAVAAPLSWGLSPGRILIGPAQLARADQAEAVLAHELAHIRRADWLFLALSRLAVALFWFNPLVWTTARELERLSELAVDEAVVRRVDRETYARTLVGLAAGITAHPAHGAAAGMTGPARSLAERIKTVMSDAKPVPSRPWLIAASIAALAAVATPIAALELTARARAQDEGAAMPVAVASSATAASIAAEASADTAGLPQSEHRNRDVSVITRDGETTRYVMNDGQGYVELPDGTRRPMTDEERREVDEARARAREAAAQARLAGAQAREQARAAHEHARAMAEDARAMAVESRAMAEHHRAFAEASARTAEHAVDRAAIREQVRQARAAADEARAAARMHQVDAGRIREQVAREMAAARVQMARGADDMVRGAQEMREEAGRLRDPAYRARKIAEQRERGHTVTDQELRDAIPKMLEGADRMEEGAARMRESSRGND